MRDYDKALRQVDRQWKETWEEHVRNAPIVDDFVIRRERLIRQGLIQEDPLSPIPDMEPCLRLDDAGRAAAAREINEWSSNTAP